MSWLPKWCVASHQVDPIRRAKTQGVIQQYIDTAISSTVNLPESATVEDVVDVYWAAYEAGCKGITVYREGSREGILQTLQDEDRVEFPIEAPLAIDSRRISFKGEHGLQRILINVGDYRPGVPCEVSIIHGKSGTEVASYASALGIMISIALQNGVSPNKIARAMEGISAGWATRLPLDGKGQKPTSVQSVPDAVAAVLKKFYGNGIFEKGVLGQPINGAVNKIGWELTAEERTSARNCPKCGKQTYIPDSSCWKCINPACDVDGVCG
jgi:ribonucleoside-diphosphate reductase alpha chain